MTRIRIADPSDGAAVDAFACEHASVFHRPAWLTAVRESLGHETLCLLSEREGRLTGILPLVDKRSRLLGRALISTGFAVGGGVAATDADAATRLAERAGEVGRARGVRYVELRGGALPDGWAIKSGTYATFRKAIGPSEDARLAAIPRKKRADLRKAIAAASRGEIGARVTGDIDGFWCRYSRAQRDHGTPVLPRAFLKAISRAFGSQAQVAEVFAGRVPVAGVLSLYHRDTVHLYHAYVTDAARRHHAGDYLYWWMMGQAQARGCSVFDLGRSKLGTGSCAYKRYWGFEAVPLDYAYDLIGVDALPDVNPQNAKFRSVTALWRRLPLPVANAAGPHLYKHLG